jgi:hypothetical protein
MRYEDIDFLPTEEIANRTRQADRAKARQAAIADALYDHPIELVAAELVQLFIQMPVLHEYDYRCYWCKYHWETGENPKDLVHHQPECVWARIMKIIYATVADVTPE